MCKVTRYSSIEKHSMCPDNEGQFILYIDFKRLQQALIDMRDYIPGCYDDHSVQMEEISYNTYETIKEIEDLL